MKKGFTLLELIIVIIVLAILASLAMPRYIRTTERARAAEALQMLTVLRGSMERYFARNQSYVGVSLATGIGCGGAYNLDVDCPNTANALFDYTLPAVAAATYTLQATRLCAVAPCDTITISEVGVITGTGVFLGL